MDLTPPEAPKVMDVIANEGIYPGSIAANDVTNDKTLLIKGESEANAVIKVYDGLSLLGTTTADESGNWSYSTSTLAHGTHSFSATATDAAGNTSVLADATGYVVTVDLQPPASPSINALIDDAGSVVGDVLNGGRTDDIRPRLKGTAEQGSTVTITNAAGEVLGTAVADAVTFISSLTLTAVLPAGANTLYATATDIAGNTGSKSTAFVVTVDLTAPGTPVIAGVVDDVGPVVGALINNSSTNDTMPTFSGTAEAGSTVLPYYGATLLGTALVSGTTGTGSWSFTPDQGKALSQGAHSITVKAIDVAGNTGAASSPWLITVDTTAPTRPAIGNIVDDVPTATGTITSGSTTNDVRPTISGTGITGEVGGMVTIHDGATVLGTTKVQSDGSWSFTPATDMTSGAAHDHGDDL
ncbi:Ig-like domain-containing protein [Neorhizobium sp. T786]|uniref:Ig-like domain-containing protein n=1 Tax=Pseudorhizobium xiangyangii TaxID=2883104 RepID=UPI001CFF8DAD|nr:Ig-like domain-containing protein [Neorhizobium xiangyangii]MCB5205539.1 Ig-like domain-containing protein [Neorhizobium xiangyangii]